MKNDLVSILEVHLQRIVDQNDTMIELLKVIAASSSSLTAVDEGEAIMGKVESLTKRERQILELIMQGMMNKQMAYELSLSLSTIEAHRSGIMKKMEVKNITQLTKEYMKYQSLLKY